MKQLSKLCIALFFFSFTTVVHAQQVHKGQIDITEAKMQQVGDSLLVEMEIDLKKLKLGTNRYLTLTPQVVTGSDSLHLSDILINGRTRSKSYKRSMALDKKQLLSDDQPHIVTRSNNKDKLYYSETISYEPWMQSAHLNLKEVLCGCGAHSEEIAHTRLVDDVILDIPPVYAVSPQFAYLEPKAEAVKKRGAQFELYLNFPVNKTNILPNYMNNASELSQLRIALEELKADKYLDIQNMNIVGYASPEGGIANNERLSKGRAEELKTHLMAKLNYPAKMYSVEYGGENWGGLLEAVETSQMEGKEDIISILTTTENATTRKNKLKAYKQGIPYKAMLMSIYPKLRKVILDVEYNVVNFTVTDAKEVMKSQPHLLSPNEMYQIANTYPAGSAEFVNAMETAVKVFPKDESANQNAATIALANNDIPLAESYLKKADATTPEYANSMGIIYLKNGELEKAKKEFEKASQAGLASAKFNLQEVQKKYEIEVLKKLR